MTDTERVVSRTEWIGFLAMVFGMFIAFLDIQIVASSINDIQAGLSASLDEISWVQTSYLIADVIAIPLSGYLSRMMSTRLLFTASAIGFTAMSVACAFATNIESMIVCRALQGFLGGAMIPTTFASIFLIFPPAKQNMASAIVGLVATLAPALGPTIGGYITQATSWHWLFLINLLPGLAIAAIVWSTVRIDRPDWELAKSIDFAGILLMALFLGSLEYVLEEGPRHDWLEDQVILTLTWLGGLAAVGFFYRAFTSRNPIVDLRAYADANFAAGSVLIFAMGITLYGIVYLLPLYLGIIADYNALQIGQVMIIQGSTMWLTAPICSKLIERVDPRLVMGLGLLCIAAGCLLNARLTTDWGFDQFIWPQVLRGMGLIFCMIPVTRLAMCTLPMAQVKNASGLFGLTRNLGGAFGLAVINSFIDSRSALHWQQLTDTLQLNRLPVREALSFGRQTLAGSFGDQTPEAATALLAHEVQQQVIVMTFNDIFLVLATVAVCALPLLLLLRAPAGNVQPGEAVLE